MKFKPGDRIRIRKSHLHIFNMFLTLPIWSCKLILIVNDNGYVTHPTLKNAASVDGFEDHYELAGLILTKELVKCGLP